MTTMQALKSRVFWQLAIAMGVSGMVMSASIHQIPAISSFGMSRETAGIAILGVSMFSVAGRLGSGYFGDRLDKRHVIAVALLFPVRGHDSIRIQQRDMGTWSYSSSCGASASARPSPSASPS